MKKSAEHILTRQAGSLPRPDDLVELNRKRTAGEAVDGKQYADRLRSATVDVVRRQVDLGNEVPAN